MATDYEPEIRSMEQFLTQSKRKVNRKNKIKIIEEFLSSSYK